MGNNPFAKKKSRNVAGKMPKREVDLGSKHMFDDDWSFKEDYARRQKEARDFFEANDIKHGDWVRVSWDFDGRFSSDAKGWHSGEIVELTDWIKIEGSPNSPGHLYLPIAALNLGDMHKIEKIDRPAKTPKPTAKKSTKKKSNPFAKS